MGRRIKKEIKNSADLDCTYHYYYDGQRMIETRNGSSQVLQQFVWGGQYIDELIQVGWNQDPNNASSGTTENKCERFFWACQDANYNAWKDSRCRLWVCSLSITHDINAANYVCFT